MFQSDFQAMVSASLNVHQRHPTLAKEICGDHRNMTFEGAFEG